VQFGDDVHHPGIAQVRAILLERKPQDQHFGLGGGNFALRHQFDHPLRDVAAHAVVDPAAGEDNLRVIPDLLRLVGEVVRIHADAVATDQTRPKRQEVPFAARRFQHFMGIDAHALEDQRQLIDQCDVDVALGVFDHLGRFGHTDAGGAVGAGADDLPVQVIDELRRLRAGAGGYLGDGFQPVYLVAGVDPLRAVAGVEVAPVMQPRLALDDRYADFFGGTRIDRRFVNRHAAATDRAAHRSACRLQRPQVRALVVVDRGRDGDDEHIAALQIGRVMAATQLLRRAQFVAGYFQGVIAPGSEFGNACLIDVVADRRQTPPERHRQRQADIAQADDGDPDLIGGGKFNAHVGAHLGR